MLSFHAIKRSLLRATWVPLWLAAASPTGAADPLLPDLIAWEDPTQCYMHCGSIDTALIPNKVLYRFIGALPSIGDGPLELREVTHPNFTQDVYQRIYDTDGDVSEVLIGTFPEAFSIPPRHLFLPGIAQYNLRNVLAAGGVGPIVSSHDKISMAVVDSDNYNTSLPGAPRFPVYDSISDPILGISIGWADVYGLGLPGQWADATGLADGQYWLEVVADPYNRIQESNEANNTTRILVNLAVPDPQIQPGDYNQDGSVDAADYVTWRNTLTQTVSPGTGADGDGDGRINGPDYDVWRRYFGTVVAGNGSTATVPEPSTLALLLTATALIAARGRRLHLAACRAAFSLSPRR